MYDSDLDTPRNDAQRNRQARAREHAARLREGEDARPRPRDPSARWARATAANGCTNATHAAEAGGERSGGTSSSSAGAAAAAAPTAAAAAAPAAAAEGQGPTAEDGGSIPKKPKTAQDGGGAAAAEQDAVAAKVYAQQQELLALQAVPGAGFGTAAASGAAGKVQELRAKEVAAAAAAKGIDCAKLGLEFMSPAQLADWVSEKGIEVEYR
jgi:hypothetical protein